MKVIVYGSGAVGGYFGARLLKAGQEVSFIARGDHLQAIRVNGIHITGASGDFIVHPTFVSNQPQDMGVADLVIIAVKAWQIPQILDGLQDLVGAQTLILPLQNGVDTPYLIENKLGQKPVIIGLCQISAQVIAPGVIRHVGIEPYLAFGEFDNQITPRLLNLRQFFESAGLKAEIPVDIHAALWDKFLFIASFGAIGAVTRAPAGVIRNIPQTRRLLEQVMGEILQVAKAYGIKLNDDVLQKRLEFIDRLPPETMASMAHDIIEKKPSELDYLIGTVVRLGEAKGKEVPISRSLSACLLPQEKTARKEI